MGISDRRTQVTAQAIFSAGLAMICKGAWGHDHGKCLWHHWSNPVYAHEMRLQLAVMAAAAVLAAVYALLRRARARGALSP